MALVRHGIGSGISRGPGPVPGAGGSGHGNGCWYRPVPQNKAGLRTEAPVRIGAALLGDASASRPVLLPVGPHHHGGGDDGIAGVLLPVDAPRPVLLRGERGPEPNPAGDAFLE